MILSRELFPEPLAPITPIFAPGKNARLMPFRISRLGGTTLRRSYMVKMYWGPMSAGGGQGRTRRTGRTGVRLSRVPRPAESVVQGQCVGSHACPCMGGWVRPIPKLSARRGWGKNDAAASDGVLDQWPNDRSPSSEREYSGLGVGDRSSEGARGPGECR